MKDLPPLVKKMLRAPVLSKEEEYELAMRMRAGDDLARQLVIEGNLCHAVRFAMSNQQFGLPIEELISEALGGMTKATERYEPERGNRFLTYAAHWMRSFMTIYILRNWRMVRPKGQNQSKLFFRLRREMAQNMTETGDFETSLDIVSAYFGIKREQAKVMLQVLSCKESSLDAPIGSGEDDATLYDLISNNEPDPGQTLEANRERQDAKEKVRRMLEMVSPRERAILELRHLQEDEDAYSLDELGKMFGVSRERIRQIEVKLFAKLQRYLRGEPMRPMRPGVQQAPVPVPVKHTIPKIRRRGRARAKAAAAMLQAAC